MFFIDHSVLREDSLSLTPPLSQRAAGASVRGNGSLVFVVPALVDGVAYVTSVLAAHHRPVRAFHILSHGFSGGFRLGNAVVDARSVAEEHRGELESWRRWLAGPGLERGDLFVYGCHVAAGTEGRLFMQMLGETVGVNVAASVDRTGSSVRGSSNWELEASWPQERLAGANALPDAIKQLIVGDLPDTGYRSPTLEGDTVAQWGNPSSAYASDDVDADEDLNGDSHDWHGFGFAVPVEVEVDGIEVWVEGNGRWEANGVDVELSWNAGTFTASGNGAIWAATGSDDVEIIGGPNDKCVCRWIISASFLSLYITCVTPQTRQPIIITTLTEPEIVLSRIDNATLTTQRVRGITSVFSSKKFFSRVVATKMVSFQFVNARHHSSSLSLNPPSPQLRTLRA